MSYGPDRCRLCPTTSSSVDHKMVMCFDANPSTGQAIYLSKMGTSSVGDVLNQHFGFKLNREHDAMAFVCKPCWQKVDDFHQFYQSVQAMYVSQRSRDPLGVEHKCDLPLLEPAPERAKKAIETKEEVGEEEDDDYNANGDDDYNDASEGFNDNGDDDYDDAGEDYFDSGDGDYGDADDDFLDGDSWADDFDMFFDEFGDDGMMDDNGGSMNEDAGMMEPTTEAPHPSESGDDIGNYQEAAQSSAERTTEVSPPASPRASTSHDFADDDDFCWPDDEVGNNADRTANGSKKAAAREKRVLREDKLIRKYIPMRCHLCSKPYKTVEDAIRHQMTVHKQKGFLVCCEQKFFSRIMLLDHCDWHRSLIA